MKNIRYIILALLLCTFNIEKVKAGICDELDVNGGKERANKVTATYKLNEDYYVDENRVTGTFVIEVKDLPTDMYVQIMGTDIQLKSDTDTTVSIDGITSGTKKLGIYFKRCTIRLGTITLNIPKYNTFADRVECSGIDPEELNVCDKWYPYTISEGEFLSKIKEYNDSYDERQKEKEKKERDEFIQQIVDFLTEYYLYIIVSIVLIIVIVVVIIVKKKRYSLE